MTATLIGEHRGQPHACTDEQHLPNCFNQQVAGGVTACQCGKVWWRGHAGTWHSRLLRETVGHSTSGRPIYEDRGWDRYFLHAPGCDDDSALPNETHVCGGLIGGTYFDATGTVAGSLTLTLTNDDGRFAPGPDDVPLFDLPNEPQEGPPF